MASVERLACEVDSELASVDDKIRDFLTNFDSYQSIPAAFKPAVEVNKMLQQLVQLRQLRGSRGSVILATTLLKILSASEGGRDSVFSPERARVTADLLSHWLAVFGYQPSFAMMQHLFSKLGSAALREPLTSKLEMADRDGWNLLRIHPAYGPFSITAVAVALLEQPKLCSADDASLWLLFASRIGGTVLQDAVCSKGEGGDAPDLRGAALQRILQEVGPRGSAAAVVEASVKRLRSCWDQSLAEATISALPRLDVGQQQAHLFVECLPLAQRCQAEAGNCSAVIQLLRTPQAVAAFKTLGRGADAAHAVANAMSSLLPARGASASPAAVRGSLELLQLSADYGAELSACTYESVINAAAGAKQKDLAEASLAAFFQAEHLASCIPARASLRALITMPGMAPHAFLAAAACFETDRRQLFLDVVVSISATEGLQSWAFAAVAEAVRGGLWLDPDAVSALVEAFLPLPTTPGSSLSGFHFWAAPRSDLQALGSNGNYSEGARAALMGFKLLAEGGEPGDHIRQSMRYWALDFICSHTQMSVPARRIMAQILVHTTDLDLTPLRHVALDLAPSAEMARHLLSSAPLPPGFLLRLMLLASDEGWAGLGGPALAALHLLPPDQQAAELSGGGGTALCNLLLSDAASRDTLAIPGGGAMGLVQGQSLLSPLLGFLQKHVIASAPPPPSSRSNRVMQLQEVEGGGARPPARLYARLVFGHTKWRCLVLKVR